VRWHDPRRLETRTVDTPVSAPSFRDLGAWEARAAALRQQVLAAAGLWADPAMEPRLPPAAEVFERKEHPDLGYAVEKVYFESLAGYFVTGNLYRPLGAGERRAAVLHPHGHAEYGRLQHDNLFSPALRCITFARMGYVAFAYDMAGYGDNLRIPHRWGDPRTWLWGATPLGLQLWNSIRALDFLAALPDVDPERLGCTGESGGGTQTFLLTAVDARVRVSAPVNMVSLHMQGGCVCENAPGLRVDTNNVEIAALCAPRPLLLVSATGDWTVNTPRLEFPGVAAVYALYGAEAVERVATVQFEAPHNYNRQSREAVYPFFLRWLPALGEAGVRRPAGPEVPGADPRPDEGVPSEDDIRGPDALEDLWVFARRPWPACPEGAAAVQNVVRWFRLRAEVALEAAAPENSPGVARLREGLLPFVQAAAGVQPVAPDEVQARVEGDLIWLGRRRRGERFAVRRLGQGAEAEATVADGAGTPGGAAGVPRGVPAVLRGSDGAAWAVYPFGTGAAGTPWAKAGRAAEAEFFLCYNRADAAWRAQDLLTAVAWLGGTASLLAAGRECAVAALLARAVAGARVESLEVELGPEWRAEAGGDWGDDDLEAAWLAPGNYVPGVLRAGGLAGLLALAAPGRVRVRGEGALGRAPLAGVRALYAALGVPEACVVE